MARRWQVIKVELVSGRGEVCHPPPGRVLVCPPGTTFADFGRAVDDAFARWDLSHLRMFTLADGTQVVDPELGEGIVSSPFGASIPRTMPLIAKVNRAVRSGDTFTYVFDLGDDWTHRCTVLEHADPEEMLGIVPDRPLSCWGWGTIPDQYGRAWEGDDGESEPPPPVDAQEVFRREPPTVAAIDLGAVRAARAAGSARDLVQALTGVELEHALQQVGSALMAQWQASHARKPDRELLAQVMISVHGRLEMRDWEGDDVLAEDLLLTVQGGVLPGLALPVSLDELCAQSSGSDEYPFCYLHRETGEVVPGFMTDSGMVGEDEAIDPEDLAWLYLEPGGTTWSDMAAFIHTVPEESARARLSDAIEGRGAFSRFRRATGDLDLVDRWRVFRDDRQWGRARALLAAHDIRTIG